MSQTDNETALREKLLLQRRRVFGDKVALLDHLEKQFGQPLIDAVDEYYGADMEKEFAEKAAALSECDIAGLNKILWEPMIPDGIEYTIHERDDGVEFSVTKCPWYEHAKAAQEFAAEPTP